MEELVGRYHDAVTRVHPPESPRSSIWPTRCFRNSGPSCLTGKLAGADKSKGRFRDYLRTVLHRLIIDHFRAGSFNPFRPATCSTRLDPTKTSIGSGAKP